MADSDSDEVQIVGEYPPRSTASSSSSGASSAAAAAAGAAPAAAAAPVAAAAAAAAPPPGPPPSTARVVSWNIDGLSDAGLLARARAVVTEVRRLAPDVVLLQEVVDQNVGVLKPGLEAGGYTWHDGGAGRMFPYYCAVALRRSSATFSGGELVAFGDTRMGRHLIKVTATLHGRRALVMTSHLESTGDPASCASRKVQFAEVLLELAAGEAPPVTLFAGDTNLRDKEAVDVRGDILGDANSATSSVADVWEALGSNYGTRWTWDTGENHNLGIPKAMKCRFDRMFFRRSGDDGGGGGGSSSGSSSAAAATGAGGGSGGGALRPTSLTLIGRAPVPGTNGLFPSDHWGMCVDFALPPLPAGGGSSAAAAAASASSSSSASGAKRSRIG
jgi:endonuclease/exonuclease/phosphatase family metal-dependent hydrolase